jgi:hypothetical protein
MGHWGALQEGQDLPRSVAVSCKLLLQLPFKGKPAMRSTADLKDRY